MTIEDASGRVAAPLARSPEVESFRVLVAVGEPLLRDALRSALADRLDVELAVSAGDAATAIDRATAASPRVAFLSASLPGDVVEIIGALARSVPACRSVVVSDDENPDLLQRAIESGASGFITTRAGVEELMETMRRVAAGDVVIPPRMLGGLVRGLLAWRRDVTNAWQMLLRLSHREREILHHLVEGHDNDTIARALSISRQTVRTHVQRILGKLDVHSRLEAAAFVRLNGLVDELLPGALMTRTPPRGIVPFMAIPAREGVG